MKYVLGFIIAIGVAVIIWLNIQSPEGNKQTSQPAQLHDQEDPKAQANPFLPTAPAPSTTQSSPAQQPAKSQSDAGLSAAQQQHRQALLDRLSQLANCKQTDTCPRNEDDPRAASYELAMELKKALDDYRTMHEQAGYWDEQSQRVAQEYLQYPDGHVQSAALQLMRSQPANPATAEVLIDTLATGYDGKLMTEAMLELTRYPQLEKDIQALFAQQLKEGAFNVARAVAQNIKPYITQDNLAFYQQLAGQLPAKSAKARYLKSAILEAEYQLSGG